jgi:hypothetical protein
VRILAYLSAIPRNEEDMQMGTRRKGKRIRRTTKTLGGGNKEGARWTNKRISRRTYF